MEIDVAAHLEVHEIRPEVLWFAKQMELKLREKDEKKGKEGWKGIPPSVFMINIRQETDELYNEVSKTVDYDLSRVISECCDIANFAMMVASNSREEQS